MQCSDQHLAAVGRDVAKLAHSIFDGLICYNPLHGSWQIATNTLERVAPLTHAVGNVLKRVFVIGFSIIIFGK